MLSQEEITDLMSLLAVHRKRLDYHLDQQAVPDSHAPARIIEEIRDSRERIADIKLRLSRSSHPVDDLPVDGSAINPKQPDATIAKHAQRRKIGQEGLSNEEVIAALSELPNWICATIKIAKRGSAASDEWGEELMRVYRFASFMEAISFMAKASEFIDRMDHHPRWENAYRTLTVWLSSWDIGQRISKRDVDLAQKLEELFKSFSKGA
jgi:pterin-4a-carbinolamine dehydratase